ncbi:MAG: hypothetical protein WBH85_05175 [Thermoanaerobaculia bacterium]
MTSITRASVSALLLCGLTLTAGAVEAQSGCDPLPAPQGTVIDVYPAQADQLRGIVAGAATGTTILLHDGLYDLSGGDFSHRLSFNTPGVTLRSASGDRDSVVLDGAYGTNEIISIHASDVVIADVTVKRAYDHPIHISGPSGTLISGMILHNLAIIDPGQQAVKINPNDNGYADFGTIECSLIQLTDTGRSAIRDNCYTGGIDAHQAWGWQVRRNRFEGFWCAQGLSEHGIHFWRTSRGTLVEENVIVDCARGIGFGLGESGGSRTYPDNPYPGAGYLGHIDGRIRNNFVAASNAGLFASEYGFDTGIALEQARRTEVYHNSIASTQTPRSSSIEWRWSNTLADIANNLTSSILKPRNGAVANLAGNLEDVPLGWFEVIPAGDLHLTALATTGAVDQGTLLPAGSADTDIDGQLRDTTPDVGADEYLSHIFADGFESGTGSVWSRMIP